MAGESDFDAWSEELADRSPDRTTEDLLCGLDRRFVEAGYQALPEAVPCSHCGEPCRSRAPDGVVRHSFCPRSPEDEERARRAEAYAAERARTAGIRGFLDRLRNPPE